MNGKEHLMGHGLDWEQVWDDAGQTGGAMLSSPADTDEDMLEDDPTAAIEESIIGGWGMMQAAQWEAAAMDPLHARYDY